MTGGLAMAGSPTIQGAIISGGGQPSPIGGGQPPPTEPIEGGPGDPDQQAKYDAALREALELRSEQKWTEALAAFEAANAMFVKQGLTIAAYEAARLATETGADQSTAVTRANEILTSRRINSATVTVTPAVTQATSRGTVVTVVVSAPLAANSIGIQWFLQGQTASSRTVMVRL